MARLRHSDRPGNCPLIEGRPEVARPRSKWRIDSNRTLRAPRQELWYPPSNAMGRFNESGCPLEWHLLRVLVSSPAPGQHKMAWHPHLLGACSARADEVIE